MEYQHPDDNAWYDIKFDCDGGETITISYVGFPQAHESFQVGRFKNLAQVEGFRRRFRRSSVQVQDNECRTISSGTAVCALNSFRDDESKFYDAIVVQVLNEDHQEGGGEEECSCRFVLRWQHGPLAGMVSTVGISDICFIQTRAPHDPVFTQFLKLAKDRLENGSSNVGVAAAAGDCDSSSNDTLPLAKERIGYGDYDQCCVIRRSVSNEEGSSDVKLSSVNVNAFWLKLRRQRKFRSANRTSEGKVHGRCKRHVLYHTMNV